MTPIDFEVTWSKVKVKLLVFENHCPLNIFWSIWWKIVKLVTLNALWEWMFPIDVQVTRPEVKVKLLVWILISVYPISYESSYASRSNYQQQTIEMHHLIIWWWLPQTKLAFFVFDSSLVLDRYSYWDECEGGRGGDSLRQSLRKTGETGGRGEEEGEKMET